MDQGVRKKDAPPLLVKEVILPHGQSSKNPWSQNDKGIAEGGQEVTGHRYKKTDQHEQVVLSLMVLQEKPLENYFEGTRKGKKVRKRKTKHHKTTIPPTELFSDGAQTVSEEWKQAEKELTEEERSDVQLLSLKIYEYEKTREEAHRKNYVMQKRTEEDYIHQLETLAKMWFKTGRRREVTKKADDDLVLPKSLKKSEETPNKKTMKISSPRERRSENSVPSPGKSKKLFKELCQPAQPQPTDSILESDFNGKLVFTDEDSDEFDYVDQNLQFRNSSR